jgi:hypothetical protein
MNVVTLTSAGSSISVSSINNDNTQIGINSSTYLDYPVTTTINDSGIVVVSSTGIQEHNINLFPSDKEIINVISEGIISNKIITINQGQQGPPGASGLNGMVSVVNYGDNRVITASSLDTEVNAESNLLFDGTTLTVGGTAVSLSGHNHLSSHITNFNTSVDTRITLAFSGLSDISNKCDTSKILIKDSGNLVKTISLSNFIDIIDEIDGGGVIFSGCP